MTVVAFLRHGSTAWNEAGRMQGRRDVPLSATGRAEVARWRIPIDEPGRTDWIASPLRRAVETAQCLRDAPPRLEPALIEMDWGEWEGERLADLRARLGDDFTRNADRGLDFRPPGGESPRDVIARVARWLASLDHRDEPIVAVTHNGVLRALLSLATGWDMTGKAPIRLQPATLHRFVVEHGPVLRVARCNVPLARPATGERADATPSSPPGAPR